MLPPAGSHYQSPVTNAAVPPALTTMTNAAVPRVPVLRALAPRATALLATALLPFALLATALGATGQRASQAGSPPLDFFHSAKSEASRFSPLPALKVPSDSAISAAVACRNGRNGRNGQSRGAAA